MDYKEKFETRKRELLSQLSQARATMCEAHAEIRRAKIKLEGVKNQEYALLGAIAQMDECLGWVGEPPKLDKLSEKEAEEAKV